MAKQRKKVSRPIEVVTLETANQISLIEEIKEETHEIGTENPTSSEILYALPYFINEKFNATRQLFLKLDPSNEKALIVSSIPPFIPEKAIELLLSNLVKKSAIKTVFIKRSTSLDGNLNAGYRTATAIFDSRFGVKEVLEVCESTRPFSLAALDIELLPHGVKKFVNDYNSQFKSYEEIQENVKAVVMAYDEHVMEQKKQLKRKRQPDEEGWITVTRDDKHVFFAKKAAAKGKVIESEKPARKKKKVEIPFYTSEAKESKLKHLQELQRKFEEDKKRIAQVQAARKFKP
uniref:Ribosomal RNA-processing protein 7 C-terminal domain-containing protein n=1 Tax=Acrobeloides nanus TaxID=290746 RepID=A0A914E515_9BILA